MNEIAPDLALTGMQMTSTKLPASDRRSGNHDFDFGIISVKFRTDLLPKHYCRISPFN